MSRRRPLDRALAKLDRDSALRLLSAASDSPGCAHRLPSLTLAWRQAVVHCPTGGREATVADLPTLLQAVRAQYRDVPRLEDWLPLDPRVLVRVEAGGDRLRIHPGLLEDPTGFLGTVRMIASAIDPVIVPAHGFGLTDVVDLLVRHMSRIISLRAEAWPVSAGDRILRDPDTEDLETRVRRIQQTPVDLAPQELISVGAVASPKPGGSWETDLDESKQLALEFLTINSADVEKTIGWPGGLHRPFVRIRDAGPEAQLPAALGLESIAAATRHFCALASNDELSALRLEALVRRRASAVFGEGAADDLAVEADHRLFAESIAILRAKRHVVLIDLVAGLDLASLRGRLQRADQHLRTTSLQDVAPLSSLADPDAAILRVVVYGGPMTLSPDLNTDIVYIHLTELEAIWGDDSVPERDSRWCFLEDLVTGPDLVGATDLVRLWRQWKRFGTFDPTVTPDAQVMIDPVPSEVDWLAAGALEPVETVLTALGMNDRTLWPHRTIDEDGAVVRSGDTIALVAVHPPMFLYPTFETLGQGDGFGREAAVLIADGIRATCCSSPAIAEFIASVDHPVTGEIHVSQGPLTDRRPGQVALGFATDRESNGFSIGLDTTWIEYLEDDPQGAHEALGDVLVHLVGELQPQQLGLDERKLAEAAFRRAWKACPPVALLNRQPVIPFQPRGSGTLATGKAAVARAIALVAPHVQRAGIAPGRYRSADALEMCREALTPAVEDALADAVSTWSPSSLRAVLSALQSAHAERDRYQRNIEIGLGAPWAQATRDQAIREREPLIRPLELLLEWLLADPPAGPTNADEIDIGPVAEVAQIALTLGVVRAGASANVHDAEVIVTPTGVFGARPTRSTDTHLDLEAFLSAHHRHRMRTHRPDSSEPRPQVPDGPIENAFESITSAGLPGSLSGVDGALRAQIGGGIDALIATLATATSLEVEDDGVALITPKDLAESAASWAGLPVSETAAAVAHLTLSTRDLDRYDLRYWETDRRERRLMAQPFVEIEGGLLIAPHLVQTAQLILGYAISDGRLPWAPAQISDELAEALNRYRQLTATKFENLVTQTARRLQTPHRAQFGQEDAKDAGIHLPGEIDLLVADHHGRIWVCEAKHLPMIASPRAVQGRINRYRGSGKYFEKLEAKVSAIRSQRAQVCDLLGVDRSEYTEVRGVFVTCSVDPCGYLQDQQALFVVEPDLADLLTSSVVPLHGHWPIGSAHEN